MVALGTLRHGESHARIWCLWGSAERRTTCPSGEASKVEGRKRAHTLDALGWSWAARAPSLEAGQQVDMAFSVERNNFQERASLQLIIKDIVATGGMG